MLFYYREISSSLINGNLEKNVYHRRNAPRQMVIVWYVRNHLQDILMRAQGAAHVYAWIHAFSHYCLLSEVYVEGTPLYGDNSRIVEVYFAMLFSWTDTTLNTTTTAFCRVRYLWRFGPLLSDGFGTLRVRAVLAKHKRQFEGSLLYMRSNLLLQFQACLTVSNRLHRFLYIYSTLLHCTLVMRQ